jgi:hypothetical protein
MSETAVKDLIITVEGVRTPERLIVYYECEQVLDII